MHDILKDGHPEGAGGHKPVKVDFVDFKMEKAFAFDPAKGEKGIVTYTIEEPARISIKVIKAGTRELYISQSLTGGSGTQAPIRNCGTEGTMKEIS